MNYGRSLVQRFFEAVVVLLVAAWLLKWAIEVLMSMLWPLLAIAAVVIVSGIGWRLWQRSREIW